MSENETSSVNSTGAIGFDIPKEKNFMTKIKEWFFGLFQSSSNFFHKVQIKFLSIMSWILIGVMLGAYISYHIYEWRMTEYVKLGNFLWKVEFVEDGKLVKKERTFDVKIRP